MHQQMIIIMVFIIPQGVLSFGYESGFTNEQPVNFSFIDMEKIGTIIFNLSTKVCTKKIMKNMKFS